MAVDDILDKVSENWALCRMAFVEKPETPDTYWYAWDQVWLETDAEFRKRVKEFYE